MSATQLYNIWLRRVKKLWPNERITRRRMLAWMITGIYLSQSVHLKKIAIKLPFGAKRRSTVQRFSRFLQNKCFHVRRWYRPLARKLLQQAASHGQVRLIADSTKIGTRHQLLMVALAYRKRALPIAWTWVRSKRGHSGAHKQLALLQYIHGLLPDEAQVLLVGDCEFGAVAVLKQVELWRWKYVLRQRSNTKVCVSQQTKWQSFGDLVLAKNQVFWYPQAILTVEHLHHTHLLATWKAGEDEPWLLATNLLTAGETMRGYRCRMWLDETFGDLKGHGVDLEQTRLRHFQRLSRLVFVVVLLYLWLITRGSQAIKNGQRHLVDRKRRRDLSLFRIGLDLTDSLCARGQSLSIRIIPYF